MRSAEWAEAGISGIAEMPYDVFVGSFGTECDPDALTRGLGEQWAKVAPLSHKNAQAAVRRYTHPFVWDGLIQRLLSLPTWAVFVNLGLLAAYAGRRRRRVNVFAN